MNSILEGLLPIGYDRVSDLTRVSDTNFLYNGLNLVYGLDGSGKSWQLVKALAHVPSVLYIDLDGANGSLFVDHCKANNVNYIKAEAVASVGKSENIDNILQLIEQIVDKTSSPITVVIDSLVSIFEGQELNNAEKISPVLYRINNHANQFGYALILVDHATEVNIGISKTFKLEGNAGGKRRTTVTVNRYEPISRSNPSKGGTFICERARGNSDGLIIGNEQKIINVNLADAIEWVKHRQPEWLNTEITAKEFAQATKHARDKWIRKFKDELFTTQIRHKKIYLKLKQK